MFPFRSRNTLAAVAAAVALVPASSAVFAQTLTAQQFARACESNPGNTVHLAQSLKLQGAFTGETQVVATGCTVTLAPDAAFELDQITLSFAGPLTVTGNRNGAVKIEKAVVNAPSIALNLTGSDSQFQMKEGRVIALAGGLDLRFGSKGKFEMVDSGGWTRGGLRASGALRIVSGTFFDAVMSNSGMEGAAGIFLAMNGSESAWKIEKSVLNVSNFTFGDGAAYSAGPLSITSNAFKASVSIAESDLRFASRAVTMHLAGAESTLQLKQVTSQTGSEAVYLGAPGYKGIAMVENSLFYGNPDIVVQSGSEGATAVIGNPGSLYAQRAVRVFTGTGGSCVVTPLSSLIAPQVNACR
jgi:hypothetical protein